MNQIISKSVNDDCSHDSKVNVSGKIVCQNCGLELEEQYVNDIFIGASPYSQRIGLSPRYVGEFNANRYVSKVGSKIGIDLNTKSKNVNIDKFKRLNTRNTHFQGKLVFKEFTTYTILNKIGKLLDIPEYILNDSAFRFKKIDNSDIEIINRISCLCFCIWDSIRHFKHYINLKELLKAFKESGHRVGGRLIIRDGAIYSEILAGNNIEKTSPKSVKDYIGRHIGALQNNKKYIKNRLWAKKFDIDPMLYILEIEKMSYKVLKELQIPLSMKGVNPFDMSASLVYFASLLISKSHNKKIILTQKKLEEFTTVPQYSIRAGYLANFKRFL